MHLLPHRPLPKRIVIYGRPGSGKSTLANRLGAILHLPVHHLDHHFYLPNWVERTQEDFNNQQYALVGQERWIIEGNNSKSFSIRFSEADLIIQISLPRRICFYRVFKRYIRRRKECGPLPQGCPNRMSWWFLVYMWRFDHRVIKPSQQWREILPQTPFISLSSQREVDAFVEQVRRWVANP